MIGINNNPVPFMSKNRKQGNAMKQKSSVSYDDVEEYPGGWVLRCPACGHEMRIRSGEYNKRYYVCQGCIKFIRIDTTEDTIDLMEAGPAPRKFAPLVVLLSFAVAVLSGILWGIFIGIGAFLTCLILGLLLILTATSLTGG